jgi:hypothetical protein
MSRLLCRQNALDENIVVKIVLDAGLQKTGSKSRQYFFAGKSGSTGESALYFPNTGREGRWHRPLYDSVIAGDSILLEALRQELATISVPLAVVSYEEFYKLSVEHICLLKEYFPSLVVVLFLRRQDQLVNSYYNQLHKSHHVALAELETFESRLGNKIDDYDYQEILLRWSTGLGRSAVRPVIYDKGKSSIDSFLGACSAVVDSRTNKEEHVNLAMDAYGLSVLRHVKRAARDEQELRTLVTDAHKALRPHFLAAVGGAERYLISLDKRRELMQHYAESNEWVRKLWFPKQKALFADLEPGIFSPISFSIGHPEAERIIRRHRIRVVADNVTRAVRILGAFLSRFVRTRRSVGRP